MTAQLENGYTRLANELMDVIAMTKFNGSQFRIVLAVIRYTYGFNRKSADMSVSYLAKATGLPERHVRKEVNRLIDGKVFIEYKEPTETSSRELGLNKNHSEWCICTGGADAPEEQLHLTGEVQLHRGGEEQMMHSGEEQLHPQERHIKDNIKDSFKDNICRAIFEHWQEQNIIVHKAITKPIKNAINTALKDNTADEIKNSMTHFSIMLKDQSYELCSYAWGIDTFLNRKKGYKLFLDDGEKWMNYQSYVKNKASPSANNKASPVSKPEYYISPEDMERIQETS